MSERIKWVDCESFTMLSVDYSDLPEGEYLDTMQELIELLMAFQRGPSDSTMLVMANVINSQTTGSIVDKLKDLSAVMDGFGRCAYAVVGERTALKRLAKAPPPGTHLTRTEQDARNWLLKQARRLKKQHTP